MLELLVVIVALAACCLLVVYDHLRSRLWRLVQTLSQAQTRLLAAGLKTRGMAILFAAIQSVAHVLTTGMLRALGSLAIAVPFFREWREMGPIPARQKNPLYRITMVERAWHVGRPHASLVHAFDDLDEALAFVRRDSCGAETVVEIVSGNTYMLKPIGPAR